jgi:hypothetical protein
MQRKRFLSTDCFMNACVFRQYQNDEGRSSCKGCPSGQHQVEGRSPVKLSSSSGLCAACARARATTPASSFRCCWEVQQRLLLFLVFLIFLPRSFSSPLTPPPCPLRSERRVPKFMQVVPTGPVPERHKSRKLQRLPMYVLDTGPVVALIYFPEN